MSDTRLRWLTVLVTAALIVVVSMGSIVGSSAAAGNLQHSAQVALADAGLDGVMVEFSGREATLSGGSHADLVDATAVVTAIEGVRSVEAADDATPPAQATPSRQPESVGTSIQLRREGDRIVIGGVVPDADAAAEIKSGAALVFGEMVSGDLQVDDSARSARWVSALPAVFGDLVAVRGARSTSTRTER
ncbi:hypothetical protein [Aeromicrobium sp. UC242_57]|uniref:hypothetical protein n=1 Tax=Aeromicrobium sp. UC242_57 TaxID=3374624 RepID=UPI0037B924CA